MNGSTVSPTDLFVLETLTWRLRVAASEQFRQVVAQSPRGWERRCERLVQRNLLAARRVVIPIIAVEEPLLVLFPRDPVPNCDQLSWFVTQRWHKAVRQSVRLLWATHEAERIVGGKAGIARQPLQVVHDLGVASIYFARRRRSPNTDERWLSEDLFRVQFADLASSKVPDAVIVDATEHRLQIAVEFAGAYSAHRLRTLFRYWQQRHVPIELW